MPLFHCTISLRIPCLSHQIFTQLQKKREKNIQLHFHKKEHYQNLRAVHSKPPFTLCASGVSFRARASRLLIVSLACALRITYSYTHVGIYNAVMCLLSTTILSLPLSARLSISFSLGAPLGQRQQQAGRQQA